MKFTNGYWLNRKNYKIQSPKEYHSHDIKENKLTVYAPYKHLKNRGDTLNLGISTIELSAPMKDVVKVKLIHHNIDRKDPSFEVNEEHTEVNIIETEENLKFKSGRLSVEVPKEGKFSLSFLGDDKLLTESKYGAQAQIQSTDNYRVDYETNIETEIYRKGKTSYMREQLTLDIDELIYGFGERFTPFIKNGQSINTWNEDGGTGSEQSYKNIPFYISNKGYGIFVNHPEKVSYEIASENVSRAQFSVEGEILEYFIIYGPSAKEVLKKYTDLTGKPALPPAWSFGLWLSTSFTTDYSESTVMKFIDEMQKREIPFNVFHFDCFWMKEFEWCNFEWNKDQFPDPIGMLKRIHEKGLKVCLWINPYIGQKSPLYKECKEKGYFLKNHDGSVWQWDLWQAGQGIIDFTNPEAKRWYEGHLERLLDMGVDCFKTDFGERIPSDAVYFDGSDAKKAHNYYSYIYNQTVFELLKRKRGENEAVVFARSGSVGSQKFPVHWNGDNLSVYSSMSESLRGGLSFLLSGFGFWSHDIGGFEENTSQDLYKRWTQFGLLSTHSRYHGNIEYRVPWNYGEEAALVTKKFSSLKNRLMPYLYKEAVNTSITGIPMMRPVFLEYEEDPTSFYLDREYFLGESLLVAPIFKETGEVRYYLPKGKWTNLLTNKVYDIEDGKWIDESYDYLNLPLLVKEESILILGNVEKSAEYQYENNATISLYQLKNREYTSKVYSGNGKEVANIKVSKDNNRYVLNLDGFVGKLNIKIYNNEDIKEFSYDEVEKQIILDM